jgi:hypothetical protein
MVRAMRALGRGSIERRLRVALLAGAFLLACAAASTVRAAGAASGAARAGQGGSRLLFASATPGRGLLRSPIAAPPGPAEAWNTLAQLGSTRERESRPRGNARAFLPALMSAVVPGAGQLRNGSVLRGVGYLVVEVTGWVAYGAFRQSSREKRSEYGQLANASWDYERYRTRAPDPDSCSAYECPCGLWSEESDQEIVARMESSDRDRFYEYITRDAYACGWDTGASRALYHGLWEDREASLDAQRWTGRLIFLNHLLSAADAFIEARSRLHVNLDSQTQLGFRLRGSPLNLRPELRLTRCF